MDLSKPLEEYIAQSRFARSLDKALEKAYTKYYLAKDNVRVSTDRVMECTKKCKASRTNKEYAEELEILEKEARHDHDVSVQAYEDLQKKQTIFFAFVESVETALTRMLHGTDLKRSEILALSGENPLSAEEANCLDSWNLGDYAFVKAFEDLLKADEYKLYDRIVDEATYLHDRWWYWKDRLDSETPDTASDSDTEQFATNQTPKGVRKTCSLCGCPYCNGPEGASCVFMRNIANDVKYLSLREMPPRWRFSLESD